MKRYLLVLFTFLISVLLYVDRACISAAKDPIITSLRLNEEEWAWVLSIFALGYALFQTPSGILADRFGPRRVLTAVIAFWSLFTALTAAAFSFASMLVVRFLFGAGEAGAFPNMARAVFSWIPMKERGLVQGINFSGSRLGAAFAFPLVALMIEAFNWQATFVVFAGIGFVTAILWYLWFRDDPTQKRGLSETELAYIDANRQKASTDDEGGGPGLSFAAMARSRNMWLAMGQYFASNFTFFFCLMWLFPYLKTKYELQFVETGFYAMMPFLGGALGNWVSGWLVDRIYRAGRWSLSRKVPAIIGFALAAIGMAGGAYMETAFGAVAFLTVGLFGADMTLSPSWALCIDIGHKNAGAVSGTMNMAGNIGSFVTSITYFYIKDWSGSATLFFIMGAALNVLAIGLWTLTRPDRPLEEG